MHISSVANIRLNIGYIFRSRNFFQNLWGRKKSFWRILNNNTLLLTISSFYLFINYQLNSFIGYFCNRGLYWTFWRKPELLHSFIIYNSTYFYVTQKFGLNNLLLIYKSIIKYKKTQTILGPYKIKSWIKHILKIFLH